MEWSPTPAGRRFTKAPAWRFLITSSGFMLERDGQILAAGHLVRLSQIALAKGFFWSSCRFCLADGQTFILDGIPNGHAIGMQDTTNEETRLALEAAISPSFVEAFGAWLLERGRQALPDANEWADGAVIDKLLNDARAPQPLPGISIEEIANHPMFRRPPHLSRDVLNIMLSPRNEMQRVLDAHDHDLFSAKFRRWRDQAEMNATVDGTRWWSQSATRRALEDCRPPHHPRNGWLHVPPMGACSSPEDVLDVQRETFNTAHAERARQDLSQFFATVEKSPLTDEQIDAVVCFDDHELVIAAAGSGKTSTMVAKAGYALVRKLCEPDQILLLAFNTDAAKELDERVKARLAGCTGIDKITSKTFHSFGKEVIRLATGLKPMLAPWMEHSGQDVHQMVDIVESLCAEDAGFARNWESFRLVFAQDIGRWDLPDEPEDWDSGTGTRGFRTAHGEMVKSKEERTIADWLFYHGINYRYEEAYKHPTADVSHRQYLPDFYFPEIDLYYEHFALDADSKAPKHFAPGYEVSAQWKRDLHARMGTS